MSPDEYWAATPFEYNAAARAWAKVRESDMTAHRVAAWLVAAWSRQPRLPSLDLVLYGVDRPKVTDEEVSDAAAFHRQMLARKKGD